MYTPSYSITNRILKNMGSIEAGKEIIDHAPLLPYYEKAFQKDDMVRTIHHGTHIEGNELNLTQAEKVMMGIEVIARARDIQEVINYRRVMEYIDKTEHKITEDFINKLHEMTVDRILSP